MLWREVNRSINWSFQSKKCFPLKVVNGGVESETLKLRFHWYFNDGIKVHDKNRNNLTRYHPPNKRDKFRPRNNWTWLLQINTLSFMIKTKKKYFRMGNWSWGQISWDWNLNFSWDQRSGGELLELRLLDTHLLDTFGSKSIARHKFCHLLESS